MRDRSGGRSLALFLFAILCGCQPGGGEDGIVTADDAEVFAMIVADETVRFTGTEPFWGGEVLGDQLRYSSMENPDGTRITVGRFAGNNGLAYSGKLDGLAFDMTITPGRCSDGMSDRDYPFVVTLKLGEETRSGCAWTDAAPFSENPSPSA